MNFLRLNLINKNGVSDHRGEVVIVPSQIESVRSFIHTDHILSHHEIGSIVTMKTGDKHHVSQHPDEIIEMLRVAAERDEEWSEPKIGRHYAFGGVRAEAASGEPEAQ